MSDARWPDPEIAADLHRRLVAGDTLAPSDFAAAVLGPLVGFLRAASPGSDDHLVVQAAGDAVLSVIRRPAVFDPARGDLPAFLRMAARGDLKNIEQRERRHHTGRAEQNLVELPEPAGNTPAEGDELPSFDDPDLAAVVAGFTDAERRVLDLMRAGERRTLAFAAALGIGDRPGDEQRAEVKRAKDRILKRLRRAREEP